MDERALGLVGWREWVALPGLGVPLLRAKVDTGARSSSLQVERQWRFTDLGAPWVGFVVRPRRTGDLLLEAAAPVLDEREVTDSGGHTTRRVFLATEAWVGGSVRRIELNLAERRGMLFPLLLGRRALQGLVVDPQRSFVQGKPPAGLDIFTPR